MMRYILLFLACCTIGFSLRAHPDASGLPLHFVANKGQWEEPFLYKGITAHADLYLEASGITCVVGAPDNPGKMQAFKETALQEPPVLNFHAYRMKWLGARLNAPTIPAKQQPFYHNYYLGNDPKRWQTNVGVYGNVDYQELYPKIDLHLGSERGNLKYDFIVHPGGDPRQILLAYEGVLSMRLEGAKLILETSVGTITEMEPYAYQYLNGVLKEVPCQYRLKGNQVQFVLPKGYDKRENLIIDPVIVFASLTGSRADNWGFTATYDHAGNLYAGGIANALGYPVSTGAFQAVFNGGTTSSTMPCDITISKFTAQGNALLYSTYLGGSEDDMPHSLIVDHDNNLVMAGKTLSNNYPTTTGAFDESYNGRYDIVISKLDSNGSMLLASTYIGGSGHDGSNIEPGFAANQQTLKFNYGDDSRSEVIVDRQNNIYLAACSQSNNFPVTPSAAKNALTGRQDGVFLKLNPGLATLAYSTFLGGGNDDAAYVLTLDTAEAHIYIAGGTSSPDFHNGIMANGWTPTYQGGIADGFICRFRNSGNYPLLQGTFIGTSAYDQCYGLQTDHENNIYSMGQSMGPFTVFNSTYSNPGSPQFLIKMDSLLKTRTYSTVFGSGPSSAPNISPVAFLVDTCQNVYISGWASGRISPGSSTNNLPITSDAFQATTDGSDFYFIVFSKNANALLFGSYFGSPGKEEHVDGGTSRFDPDGVVYQAICASCGNGTAFPSTSGAYSSTKGSNNCNVGVVKIAFNLGSVSAAAAADPDTTGCVPFTVNFGNTSANATAYTWDFGDGSPPSNAVTPSHTYTREGNFTVRMIASNPLACKVRDTVYMTIKVSNDTIKANFSYSLEDTCSNPKIRINNTSSPMPGHTLADASFQWFFGDGAAFTGQNPPLHTYSGPGTYTVMLIMTDRLACNSPDTFRQTFTINQIFVKAGSSPPDTVCVGTASTFNNTSANAQTYQWFFGDGQGSGDSNPSHTYTSAGTYTVLLIASNPTSCNKADSVTYTVTVNPQPIAAFNYTPLLPETNKPIAFHNRSQNAQRYTWTFGDGNSSTEPDPVYQYQRSGTFNVCLTAYSDKGCADKVCKTILSDVLPLADVPTGFSPNGDGSNDVLYVRGFGIAQMDFRIFNRWGEQVFESQEPSKGWDGTYKGVPQEMEAYAFILQVTFHDGSILKKKGNVTLLR